MLDRYSKTFFWIFIILGMLWGWMNRPLIDYYLAALWNVVEYIANGFEKLEGRGGSSGSGGSLGDIPAALVAFALIIIIAFIAIIIWAGAMIMLLPLAIVMAVLFGLKLHYVLIGAIIVYPFYVLFLNLFEFFLLSLIRHPVLADIRYITYRRELVDNRFAEMVKKKLDIPVEVGAPPLAAHILDRDIKKAKKLVNVEEGVRRGLAEQMIEKAERLVDAEMGLLYRMRQEKIRQVLRELERLKRSEV